MKFLSIDLGGFSTRGSLFSLINSGPIRLLFLIQLLIFSVIGLLAVTQKYPLATYAILTASVLCIVCLNICEMLSDYRELKNYKDVWLVLSYRVLNSLLFLALILYSGKLVVLFILPLMLCEWRCITIKGKLTLAKIARDFNIDPQTLLDQKKVLES
jgi:hypothetical protein